MSPSPTFYVLTYQNIMHASCGHKYVISTRPVILAITYDSTNNTAPVTATT